MSLPVLDRASTLEAAEKSTRDFVALLRSVPDPSATAIGHWSIAELACHISHVYKAAAGMLRGEGSPIENHRNMAAEWDRHVAEDPERDLERLASRIEASWHEVKELLQAREWTAQVGWHGKLSGPTYTVAAVIISEGLIHGLDIAKASGRDWSLDPEHARMAIFGFMPNLPDFTNEEVVRKLDATFELRVRGGWWVYVTVSGGKLEISEVTERPIDCRLSVDPVAYLLVGFNRENQYAAIARGQVFAWGRKPWLGLTFGKLFDSP